MRNNLALAAILALLALPLYGQTIRPTRVSQLRLTQLTTAQEGGMTLAEGDVWYNTDLNCIRQRVSGTTTTCIANGENPISVKSFGAVGDGVTDDTVAIQAAIDAAKIVGFASIQGTPVSFPCGKYLISSPLVLPRTGLTPTNVVHLLGASLRCVRIQGDTATFPTNRALVEWEVSATRAWHQSIKNITFNLPDVTGTMAINYKPTDKSTGNAIRAEALQIDLWDILVENKNEFHDTSIYLEGNIKLSSIKRIYCDPGPGLSFVSDTLCLKVDTDDFGGEGDSSGFNLSSVEGIYAGIRRGGRALVFEGRLSRTTFRDSANGVGGRNGISYNFINCIASTIENIANEGGGEKPQIKFDSCDYLTVINFGLGSPVDGGSGVGNGMELVDTDDSRFISRRARSGSPLFSASGVKVLTVDANSERNTMLNFGLVGSNSTEVTISAADTDLNYFEFFRQDTGVWESLGRLRRGEMQIGNILPDVTFDNDADSAVKITLDAGATTGQLRDFCFSDQGAEQWCIRVSSGGIFSVEQVGVVDRIRFAPAGDNVYTTFDTAADHRFVDLDGLRRITLHGDSDKISFGAALDTNLYRSAGNTLKTDDTFVVAVTNSLEGELSNIPRWILKVVDFGDMTAGATADTFTLWTLPANTMIHDVVGTVVTGWSGGSISAAVCSVGTNGGAANDLTLDDNFFAAATRYELHDATASGGKGTLLFDTTDKFAPYMAVAAATIEIQCDLTGDNHVNATAGQARIYILVSQPLGNTTTEAN